MKKALTEKLEAVVGLIDVVDPDVEVEYCIPDTGSGDSAGEDPYILVKCSGDNYIERKIRLTDKYWQHTAQEIANLVTFSIEQFKEEMDAIRYDQG